MVCLLVACLTSQQRASVSQERIWSDDCMCCHTEIEVFLLFTITSVRYTGSIYLHHSHTLHFTIIYCLQRPHEATMLSVVAVGPDV